MNFEFPKDIFTRNENQATPSPAIEKKKFSLLKNGVLYEKKKLDIDGEYGENMDMYQRITLTPSAPKNDVVFFSGFTNRAGTIIDELSIIADETSSRIHGLDELPGEEIGTRLYEHEEKYAQYGEQVRKAITVAEFARFDGIKNIDVIAHSQGAIESLIMADINPGMVKNIVLVNPAGIIPMSEKELSYNGIKEFASSMGKKGGVPVYEKAIDVVSNYKMLEDSRLGISEFSKNEDMVEIIQRVRAQGTKVSIIMTDNDKLFNITKMREEFTKEPGSILDDKLDNYAILAGNHGSMFDKDNLQYIISMLKSSRGEMHDSSPEKGVTGETIIDSYYG